MAPAGLPDFFLGAMPQPANNKLSQRYRMITAPALRRNGFGLCKAVVSKNHKTSDWHDQFNNIGLTVRF